ncbi:hypothetical protein [Neobacillus cucumis]|nr:hypothetical protein [Neobacillus cucumis]MBM7654565.1 hypothetical protein [Neobacillus cucumis]
MDMDDQITFKDDTTIASCTVNDDSTTDQTSTVDENSNTDQKDVHN